MICKLVISDNDDDDENTDNVGNSDDNAVSSEVKDV